VWSIGDLQEASARPRGPDLVEAVQLPLHLTLTLFPETSAIDLFKSDSGTLLSTAVLHALSTLIGYHWSRKTRDPTALVFSATSLTRASSLSSRQVMRMRALFRGSLVTATHRHPPPSSPSRIPFSISCLVLLAFAAALSASSTLDTSTVQYKVSAKVDGVV
jgi:hypothetical protein